MKHSVRRFTIIAARGARRVYQERIRYDKSSMSTGSAGKHHSRTFINNTHTDIFIGMPDGTIFKISPNPQRASTVDRRFHICETFEFRGKGASMYRLPEIMDIPVFDSKGREQKLNMAYHNNFNDLGENIDSDVIQTSFDESQIYGAKEGLLVPGMMITIFSENNLADAKNLALNTGNMLTDVPFTGIGYRLHSSSEELMLFCLNGNRIIQIKPTLEKMEGPDRLEIITTMGLDVPDDVVTTVNVVDALKEGVDGIKFFTERTAAELHQVDEFNAISRLADASSLRDKYKADLTKAQQRIDSLNDELTRAKSESQLQKINTATEKSKQSSGWLTKTANILSAIGTFFAAVFGIMRLAI